MLSFFDPEGKTMPHIALKKRQCEAFSFLECSLAARQASYDCPLIGAR